MKKEVLEDIVRIIRKANYCIVFTGAGISAESGIPTFRGKNGLWKKYDPEKLATLNAFMENPKLVWEWYRWRLELVLKAKPNLAHKVLSELEKLGIIKCVITQNVDGLHKEAGSKCIVELHGNIRRARCIKCDYVITWKNPPTNIPPKCPKCFSLLRPDVVWFGEPLPENEWRKAIEHAMKSDVILVIGTSGVVYPASLIPYIVKENNGIIIEINTEDTKLTLIADYVLRGKATTVLSRLYRLITGEELNGF